MSSPLAPHVAFALRRSHAAAVRDLADARTYLQRMEEGVARAREGLIEATEREKQLGEALVAHAAATADASDVHAAERRQRDRERAREGLPPVIVVNPPQAGPPPFAGPALDEGA